MKKQNLIQLKNKIFKIIKENNLKGYLFLIFILLCVRSSVLGSYVVPTGSMIPTILKGDYFFANKLAYRLKIPFTEISLITWGIPERGDIIAFKYPKNKAVEYTKRVIGVPGDVIEIKDKQLIINGEIIKNKFFKEKNYYFVFKEDLFGVEHFIQKSSFPSANDNQRKIKVPVDRFFVMGDNRDDSSDSRVWGFVPVSHIEGKLIFRYFSVRPGSFKFRLNRIGFFK